MPELGDELRQVADQAACEARPLSPAEVMRRGERRRRRRLVRDGVAALAAAGVITAGILFAALPGGHPVHQTPATSPTTAPSPAPSPSPSRSGHRPVSSPKPSR